MTIGVGAVLTMVAIGTGAESAIEDQIRAAGMNLIVVTAGNYKVKSTEDFGGGAVEPSAVACATATRRRALAARSGISRERRRSVLVAASRRRPDGETRSPDREAAAGRRRGRTGIGRHADGCRCRRDPARGRRPVRRRGSASERARQSGRQALVHPASRHRHDAAADPPRLDVQQRPFFQDERTVARRTGDRARQHCRRKAVRDGGSRSARTSRSGISRSRSSGS